MVQINFARKEINCKIVYYGPGLSGKTTSLEVVHARTPDGNKGELTSISTDGDRTLFFDFMPLDLGTIAGMKTKFHLYTVPGQVYYNSTRKLVLLGADGIIFVADSTPGRMEDNVQSMENLRENLAEMGRDVNKVSMVIQYNKRDVPNAMTVDEMNEKLNPNNVPTFESSAKTGEGVFQTLKAVSALVLEDINSNEKRVIGGAAKATQAATPPAAPAAKGGAVGQPEGLMPERDPKQVLRPAAQQAEAAAAVAAPPATKAAPQPARREAPRKAVRARTSRRSTPQAAAPRTAARPRPATRSQAAPAAAPQGSSSAKTFVFVFLGILAGAAAAVLAAKYFLGMGA